MPRSEVSLPQVDVDPALIRDMLRDLAAHGDEAGNDWSWLSAAEWALWSRLSKSSLTTFS